MLDHRHTARASPHVDHPRVTTFNYEVRVDIQPSIPDRAFKGPGPSLVALAYSRASAIRCPLVGAGPVRSR
jgi:hypothetical protein